MISGEAWLRSLDLATIATWVMIIGVALLLYLTRSPGRSSKKK